MHLTEHSSPTPAFCPPSGTIAFSEASPGRSSFLLPFQMMWIGFTMAGWLLLLSTSLCETAPAQDQTTREQTASDRNGPPALTSNAEQAGQQTDEPLDEHAYDETAALGVIVSTCPGDAVCVHGTIWGSPAQEADIREGDYILSINQQPVKSPRELQAAVRKADPEQKVKLVMWRQGQTLAKELDLAQAAEELPQGHSAWLGVQLKDTQQGVTLDRVVRGSPAEKAGLNEGDVVTKLNGEAVEEVAGFVETIADMGPGSELQLNVRRQNQEKNVTAQLGSIDDAPVAYLRHAFGAPQWEGQSATSQSADEVIDLTIDALREEMRELRRQVEELKGRDAAVNERDNESDNDNRLDRDNLRRNPREGEERPRRRRIQPQESQRGESQPQDTRRGDTPREDIDNLDVRLDTELMPEINQFNQPRFVMQRGQNRDNRNWDNRTQRNRNWYNDYRRDNNRWSYPPIYRSPYYGNSYFRNGGRYYYYGNPGLNRNYGYGYGYGYGYPRGSGLRLSPNLGFYWY